MPKCKTYVDSNVLMAAFQGKEETFSPVPYSDTGKPMAILDDPAREFIVSDFLRLETIPKPTFHKREEEVAFMEAFLESAQDNIPASPSITGKAVQFAGCHNIHPMDALHLSAALHAEADEFVTLEKPEKPMFRVQELKITSLHSPAN